MANHGNWAVSWKEGAGQGLLWASSSGCTDDIDRLSQRSLKLFKQNHLDFLKANFRLFAKFQWKRRKPISYSKCCMLCLVTQSRPTLCSLTDCRLPGSSVHRILQARIQEWVAMPSSRGSSHPRDWTQVSHIADRFFTIWATREAREYWCG